MEITHVMLRSFHLNGRTKGFQISLTDVKTLRPCARQQTVNIIVWLEKLIVEWWNDFAMKRRQNNRNFFSSSL